MNDINEANEKWWQMLAIRLFCSGVIEVPSGPKSHTFTVILAVFAPQLRSGADGGFFDRRGPDIVYGGNIGAISPSRTANGALF